MYSQLPKRNQPTYQSSTPTNQNIFPTWSFATLPPVVQRAKADENSLSGGEKTQPQVKFRSLFTQQQGSSVQVN